MRAKSASLLEGPIWKSLLMFALPVFLGNLFQQFYNAFDSWVVGRYLGESALAAVSSSGNLIFLMVGFFNGLAMGAGAVIARQFGARDYTAMRKTIHTNITFGLFTGITLTVIGVAFTPTILRWMGTPEDVIPQSVIYFRYYFYGATFTVLYNIFVGILHAVGDSRHPLYYLMCSTAINMILDLVLVGGLGMGVGAAAMATTISQGVSALLCCIHLLRAYEEPYQLNFRELGIDRGALQSIIRIGLPSGLQNSAISLANVVVQANINSFGTAAMAGCGAYSKLEGFAFLPVTCFAQSLATFVGQNLGAGKYDRVKKGVVFGYICSMSLAELIGVVFFLFAPYLISFFNNAPETVAYGTLHMRTICLFYCLLAYSHCTAGIMRGAGRASVPMFTMLVCWCLIRVTYITVALQFVNELQTVSRAYPITWILSGIAFTVYLFRTDWMHGSTKTA